MRGCLSAILLAATCLTPIVLTVAAAPAWAAGGAGGVSPEGDAGGAGGTSVNTGAGGNGADGTLSSHNAGGGGGGGAGETGGVGGDGAGRPGGLGGTAGGGAGGNGGNTVEDGGSGSGGGGGAHGVVSGALTGGNGGTGGTGGSSRQGGAGGGGAGGYGAVVTGAGALGNLGLATTGGIGGAGGRTPDSGSPGSAGGDGGTAGDGGHGLVITSVSSLSIGAAVQGGAGGAGGNSSSSLGNGGDGGSGGAGLVFTTGGAVTINGTVSGGTGGAGGSAAFGTAGAAGPGGAGIVGSGLTVINNGAITGGLGGDGVTRANAITFTGGTNTLQLQAGSTINGNVVASGTSTLQLGGSVNPVNSFDVSQIGNSAQYRNFSAYEKVGSSTWTLSGTTTALTPWSINAGTLAISAATNLGDPSGGITFNGGTLLGTADLTLSNDMIVFSSGTVAAGTGTTLTLSPSSFSGSAGASLTFGSSTNTGTVVLSLAGQGPSLLTVAGGTLTLSGGTQLLSSSVTVNGTFDISNNGSSVGMTTLGGSGTVQLGGNGLAIANGSTEFSGAIVGTGGLEIFGGTQTLSGVNSYTNATQIDAGAALALKGGGSIASSAFVGFAPGNPGEVATLDISQTNSGAAVGALFDPAAVGVISLGSKTLTVTNGGNFGGVIQDGGIAGGSGGGLTVAGNALDLGGVNTYTGATTIQGGATLSLTSFGSIATSSGVNLSGAGAVFDIAFSSGNQAIKDLSGVAGSTVELGANTLTLGTANLTSFGGAFAGTGGLVKQGSGTLTLTGASTYSDGTTINAGLINFAALNNFGTGPVTLNGGGVQWAAGTSTDISSQLAPLGAAGGTFDTNGNNVTFATALSGTGGLTKQGLGQLTLTGNNTFTGVTTVAAGILAVNGSLASSVTLNNGILGGSGTIGGLIANGGIVAPGNSIGTLTVNGNVVQNAGNIYQVEVNNAGQGDRINATGSATINGATVQVIAAPGNYANSTTYTILNATGGVSGTYAGVSSSFAFLTPTLSYDANNVFLTLALQGNAFSGFGGNTTNQRAVGYALDQSFANASGDFATVIGALAGLSTTQGPLALNTISGQPYADFGTVNVQGASLFMNAVGQQMALARGTAAGGQRQALAQACEVEACEGTSPFSVWGSVLGGLGSVQGNGNSSTLTYNFGGGAAGIDYRLDPRFLVGIGAGYTHGTQWVDSFMGKGWTDAVSVTAYGSFTQDGFYADALVGYAYSNNQLQRQIQIPGLQPRTANGSTGANQFLGQVETGYKIPVFAAAQGTVTPFGRLQVSSVNQASFSEWGANSLSLNVAQQTTNSLRSTFGADLAGAIVLSDTRTLALALRLGWQHEFADTGRPITAAFAGAPSAAFTVLGATPQRDSAVIGFSARTNIADSTQLYLRYDGEVGSGTDNHALNVGVRLTW